MKIITNKKEISQLTNECIQVYKKNGLDDFVLELEKKILNSKVKFPVLEHSAKLLYLEIEDKDHILFCTKIQSLQTIGGNVITGIILQNRLQSYFNDSIKMAAEYISKAEEWYICDIIGERVFGFSLLKYPDKTLPQLKKLIQHPNKRVVRSVGAGFHYSIKNGLSSENVEKIFILMLVKSNDNDKDIKQGFGWSAKTTAKFHPEIIQKYKEKINNKDQTSNWFSSKVKIGLERNKYAKRNSG